jgi:hypothetical protein
MLLAAACAHVRPLRTRRPDARESGVAVDARRAPRLLVPSSARRHPELSSRVDRAARLQAAQTLQCSGRNPEAVELLRALRVPDDEEGGHHRFLRARLLGIARLSAYRDGRDGADLRAALAALEYCFGIDPDEPLLVHHYGEAERLLLERLAERILPGEGADAPRSSPPMTWLRAGPPGGDEIGRPRDRAVPGDSAVTPEVSTPWALGRAKPAESRLARLAHGAGWAPVSFGDLAP